MKNVLRWAVLATLTVATPAILAKGASTRPGLLYLSLIPRLARITLKKPGCHTE